MVQQQMDMLLGWIRQNPHHTTAGGHPAGTSEGIIAQLSSSSPLPPGLKGKEASRTQRTRQGLKLLNGLSHSQLCTHSKRRDGTGRVGWDRVFASLSLVSDLCQCVQLSVCSVIQLCPGLCSLLDYYSPWGLLSMGFPQSRILSVLSCFSPGIFPTQTEPTSLVSPALQIFYHSHLFGKPALHCLVPSESPKGKNAQVTQSTFLLPRKWWRWLGAVDREHPVQEAWDRLGWPWERRMFLFLQQTRLHLLCSSTETRLWARNQGPSFP